MLQKLRFLMNLSEKVDQDLFICQEKNPLQLHLKDTDKEPIQLKAHHKEKSSEELIQGKMKAFKEEEIET